MALSVLAHDTVIGFQPDCHPLKVGMLLQRGSLTQLASWLLAESLSFSPCRTLHGAAQVSPRHGVSPPIE